MTQGLLDIRRHMADGSLAAGDQLAAGLDLIMIVLIVQTGNSDNVWLRSDQGTEVDVFMETCR